MSRIKPPIVPEQHIDTVAAEDFRKMLRTCESD